MTPRVEPLPRVALRCELLSDAHLLHDTRQKLFRNVARSSRACGGRAFVWLTNSTGLFQQYDEKLSQAALRGKEILLAKTTIH